MSLVSTLCSQIIDLWSGTESQISHLSLGFLTIPCKHTTTKSTTTVMPTANKQVQDEARQQPDSRGGGFVFLFFLGGGGGYRSFWGVVEGGVVVSKQGLPIPSPTVTHSKGINHIQLNLNVPYMLHVLY